MIDDLETALEVEAARAGSTTGEATSVLDAVPPPKRKLSGPRRAGPGRRSSLLLLVAGGALLAVQLISSGDRRRRRERRARGTTVAITSATDYDPQGDGEEVAGKVEPRGRRQPDRDRLGTPSTTTPTTSRDQDGPDPASASTSPPSSPATPAEMVVRTPTPGWDAAGLRRRRPGRRTTSPGGTNRSAKSTDAGDSAEIELERRQPLPLLPALVHQGSDARADQDGRYRLEISDIKLLD